MFTFFLKYLACAHVFLFGSVDVRPEETIHEDRSAVGSKVHEGDQWLAARVKSDSWRSRRDGRVAKETAGKVAAGVARGREGRGGHLPSYN